MKKLLCLIALTLLCCGCVTSRDAETVNELQVLNARMDKMENRILELDRDIAFLLDEKIKKAKKGCQCGGNKQ